MIKKICVVVLLVVMLFPASAMANDGGPWLDTHNYITTEVTVDKRKAAIGEEIKVTITCENNTPNEAEIMAFQLFDKTSSFFVLFTENFGDKTWEVSGNGIIAPGEKNIIEVILTVPEDINWYIKNGKYYANININMEYGVQADDWRHEEYFFPELKPIPIEITNIEDGSDMFELEVIEDTSVFNFPVFEHTAEQSFSNTHYYFSEIINKVKLHNKSSETIEGIKIVDTYNNKVIDYLASSESKTEEFELYERILHDKIPLQLSADYKVLFTHNGTYYAVGVSKEYPTNIISPPKVKVSLIDYVENTQSNGYDYSDVSKVVSVTNLSEYPILNLYFDIESDFYNNPNNIIPNLSPFQTVYLPYQSDKLDISSYFIGYILENNFYYFWHVVHDSDLVNNNSKFDHYDYYITMEIPLPIRLIPLSENPTPAPIPTPTPSPTENITPTPTSSKTPTAPPIEITSVKKQSSIPFWVWYVLGAAVIGASVVIFIIKKKRIPHDD